MLLLSPGRLFDASGWVDCSFDFALALCVLAPQVTVGALGLTVTVSLTKAVLVSPLPSTSVAVARSEERRVGKVVTARLDRGQVLTSIDVVPTVAVKLCPPAPSLSVSPTGIPLTTSD